MTGLNQLGLSGLLRKHGVICFGGGGLSTYAVWVALGELPASVINHNPRALEMHRLNFPTVPTICDDVWNVDTVWDIPRGPVRYLWASPACQHFSSARTHRATPREEQQRALCEVVIPFMEARKPETVFIENIERWAKWGPLDEHGDPIPELEGTFFNPFVERIRALGYSCEWRVLNSAEYGMPTSRKRLYMICRANGKAPVWPKPTHGDGLLPQLPALGCLDLSLPTAPIWEHRAKNGSIGHPEATLARIATGFRKFCLERPPVVIDEAAWFGIWKGNGERHGQEPRTWDILRPLPTIVAGGIKQRLVALWLRKDNGKTWGQPADEPMHTITCKDTKRLMRLPLGEESSPKVRRFFADRLPGIPPVVTVDGVSYPIGDIEERTLSPRELARGMGLPDTYILPEGVSEAVERIGNGISIEPAASIVRANVEPLETWVPPRRKGRAA
mgnify:CR=1 FL=1